MGRAVDDAFAVHLGAAPSAEAITPDPRAIASAGLQGPSGGLPHLAQVQRSFGEHDLSTVPAYVGGAATTAADRLGAVAYAADGAVAFREAPDLFTAAHEAAHVVQQRAGVQLSTGIGASGDRYEQHADRVAALVVAGESAEAALDEFAGDGRGTVVQRSASDDVVAEAPDECGREEVAPDSAVEEAPDECAPEEVAPDATCLTDEYRAVLIGEAQRNILLAFTAFSTACLANKLAMDKVAKTRAEWTALLIDVAMGYLIPGVGSLWTALGMKVVAAAGGGVVSEAAEGAVRVLVNNDVSKAQFTAWSKTTCQMVKDQSKALFGSSDTETFLTKLNTVTQIGFSELASSLDVAKSPSDADLLRAWVQFDPRTTNAETYGAAIATMLSNYQRQVADQGVLDMDDTTSPDQFPSTVHSETLAIYVLAPAERCEDGPYPDHALALARNATIDGRGDGWVFLEWIAPEMRALASERTQAIAGHPPQIVPHQIVDNLPAR